jgi:hypothetical protein
MRVVHHAVPNGNMMRSSRRSILPIFRSQKWWHCKDHLGDKVAKAANTALWSGGNVIHWNNYGLSGIRRE